MLVPRVVFIYEFYCKKILGKEPAPHPQIKFFFTLNRCKLVLLDTLVCSEKIVVHHTELLIIINNMIALFKIIWSCKRPCICIFGGWIKWPKQHAENALYCFTRVTVKTCAIQYSGTHHKGLRHPPPPELRSFIGTPKVAHQCSIFFWMKTTMGLHLHGLHSGVPLYVCHDVYQYPCPPPQLRYLLPPHRLTGQGDGVGCHCDWAATLDLLRSSVSQLTPRLPPPLPHCRRQTPGQWPSGTTSDVQPWHSGIQ